MYENFIDTIFRGNLSFTWGYESKHMYIKNNLEYITFHIEKFIKCEVFI